jgi:hypothetical protein
MELEEIKFSTNWNNKLSNKSFSTIRIFNSNKYIVGYSYKILLKENYLFDAKIEFEKGFYLNQLSEPMARLDTGYSRNETIEILKKMYKNKIDLRFHYIILNKL